MRKINGRVEEPLEGILQKYGSDVSGAGENKNEIPVPCLEDQDLISFDADDRT